MLFFTALDLASITSPVHNWVLFLLWLHPFILSGVISPLISSSRWGVHLSVSYLFAFNAVKTSNAEEAEVERFYEDLNDQRELTPPKDVLFIIGD